jgi:hypothetical protein
MAAHAAPSARGRRARRARPYLFVATRGAAALIWINAHCQHRQTMVAGVEKVLGVYGGGHYRHYARRGEVRLQADADVVGCPGRRLHDGGQCFQSAEPYGARRLAGQGPAVRKPDLNAGRYAGARSGAGTSEPLLRPRPRPAQPRFSDPSSRATGRHRSGAP